ncbi:bifunctional 2-C-methyl-D-erythritol 4-phosphate cytidylyltransferase/2-C-methyl-D-erythritol 2,4-cyclodiphosphate synthase [Parasphingopyxis marina]|uniref:Bifunctional enzyme IspD/IspF n=1 Tax=Parasphingopyxis marina TaxID=2761622 RepID=A0A842HZ76_9SPHN|nr:bifunctional 2-C-methyl-D-erythritol 4-phosphate cytidylyltransferase/2-C-methyl-D-erythritol 2,4-cyclodiphosphate synthase [Parasphingopyxis marina]MBC2777817.1 bifunctional 2-C-methyl-D-erythritol 4-phosphate cytidylyltransferase/2-C-methyl-D-erythritol 2,4-cyclodiphosphate synthase [Parasphingopyxis marina]
MADRPKVAALIVAAGKGERAGGVIPKQYREIGGNSVLFLAAKALLGHPAVDRAQVVIGEGQREAYETAVMGLSLPAPIIGGETRQQSVRNGLEALAATESPDIVLIHDAARPDTPPAVIDRLLSGLGAHIGAIPALPVTDSLARTDGSTVDRSAFVSIQTPQAFRFEAILAAHRSWSGAEPATDDAAIARAAGHEIALIEGDAALRKLTFAEDFAMSAAGPTPFPPVRTGSGFDVHAFGPGDAVWLGGIEIPHDRALSGHSDADVALHALTDAILGAAGAGDIGDHFPPSDPQWKGAPSRCFLEHAATLARGAAFEIWHVDVTIICEAPKIGPHRTAMRQKIAEILAIPENSVSVKATTSEGLGFTGRREGIAAQAVATLGKGRN